MKNLYTTFILVLLALCGPVVFAATPPTASEQAFAWFKNYVKNPGAELGKSTYGTNVGVTVSANSTTPLTGKYDFSFTMDADTDVVEWGLEPFDKSLANDTCEASFNYTVAAYGDTVIYGVYRNNVLVSQQLGYLSTTSSSKSAAVKFPCGDNTYPTYIRVKKLTSDSAAIKIDDLYGGRLRTPAPAQINVGGTFKGGIIHPATANCTGWTRSTVSIDFGDFPTDSDCPVPTGSNLLGDALAPASKKPSIRFSDLPAGYYNVVVNGWIDNSSGRPCHWRVSDGTSASNRTSGNNTVNQFSNSFLLNRTSNGAAEITVQSTADGAGGSSGTCSILPDSAGRDLSIMVYKMPDEKKISGTIITDEPWEYLSAKMTTRVTSTPDAEGEYRSYAKNGSAFTGTDAAPATAPSTANGFKLTAVAYGSSGGSSGEQRYEFFVGKDLTVLPEWYSTTGRTGAIDTTFREYGGSTLASGVSWNYDPVSGVIFVDVIPQSTSTTSRYVGWTIPTAGGAYSQSATGYFDFKLFKNPLAAGLKSASDVIHLYGANGFGSTNTMARRFTNVAEKKGDCIAYTDDASLGAYFTLNCEGFYGISYSDYTNSAGAGWAVITQGTYNSNPTGSTILATEGGTGYSGNTFNPSVQRWFQKGTIIRAQNTNTAFGGDSSYTSFTISKAPSPFEVPFGSGGSDGIKKAFIAFGGSTEPSACSSATCTAYRKSSGISIVTRSATGTYSVIFTSGFFSQAPVCSFQGYSDGTNIARTQIGSSITNSSWPILVRDTNTQSNVDASGMIQCSGF